MRVKSTSLGRVKPKLTLNEISGADHVPISDPCEAANSWGSVFMARVADIPGGQGRDDVVFVLPARHDMNWAIGLNEFEQLLFSNRESAPGPDALPYNVYCAAGGIGAKFLFAAYPATFHETALPEGFGASTTVFVPKSSDVNAQGHLIRSPDSAMCSGLRRYSIECYPAHHD